MASEGRKPISKARPRLSARRDVPCGHASAHRYYCFRTHEVALEQRDIMARAPEFALAFVSPLMPVRPTGWTWIVCPDCFVERAGETRG